MVKQTSWNDILVVKTKQREKKEVAEMSGTSIQNVRNVLSVAKESLIKKYIERNAEIITAHIKIQEL